MIFNSPEIPQETKNDVNALCARNRLPQSILLSGGSAALREKCLMQLAGTLFCSCEQAENKPCGNCSACKKLKAGSHPDIIRVLPEKDKKTLGVTYFREEYLSSFYVAPNEASCKIYVFPDGDSLSELVQNTLLKIVEEPPEFICFIVLAESRDRLLPTMISRLAEFKLGDSLSSKSRKNDEKATETAAGVASALYSGNEYELFKSTAPMVRNRLFIKSVAEALIAIVRDAAVSDTSAEMLSSAPNESVKLASAYSEASLLKIKAAMDTIISDAQANANENLLVTRFSILLSAVLKERKK